jgi:hypothetical protein
MNGDKTELEELVRVCQLKFRTKGGYWWNTVGGPIAPYVMKLFQLRHKATNPKHQLGYKKMINFIYGK